MTAVAQLYNQAVQHHQAGQLAQALPLYRQVLQLQPNHAGALHLLGVIACQTGNLQDGIASYQKALNVQPNHPEAHYNLALALQLVGRIPEAINHYQAAIALQPGNPEAHYNLGTLLVQTGQTPQGVRHYQQAIALKPDYGSAYASLGLLHAEHSRVDEGVAHLNRAIQAEPTNLQFYHQVAHLLSSHGCIDDGLPYLQQALTLQPHPQLHYSIGKTLEEQGRTEAAIAQFRAAIDLMPDCAEAFWQQELLLPVLYDSPEQIIHYRHRFCRNLNNLIQHINLSTPPSRAYALQGLGSRTNFYLAYQGLNDRGLQSKYGEFLHRIMAANFPQWAGGAADRELGVGQSSNAGSKSKEAKSKESKSKGFAPRTRSIHPAPIRKIRIGYLSAHLMAHSAAAWARGWIRHRDRARFEVYCYHTSQRVDFITQEFQAISDVFRHIPATVAQIAQQVRDDRLDVLIFTDIGMEAQTSLLAGLRLAPVQCTAWGHPVTSGIPTIDYYLSSELMEPEHAQQHYRETLICLPNIGICYPKPGFPTAAKSRADFGLREDAIVYLSFQSPFKYLPQYDRGFAHIAQQVPTAQFVFMRHSSAFVVERFQQRLQRAFAEVGLNSSDFCSWLPKQDREDFWNLNLVSDVALDAFEWSGGNSTLEAVAFGLPVVTCPGQFMRGRHSYAILKRLGVEETIATDEASYITIATQLGQDPVWRQAISAKLKAGHAKLYDDRECVLALEAFLQTVV